MNTHSESYSHIYFNIGLPSPQMVGLGAGQGVVLMDCITKDGAKPAETLSSGCSYLR